MSELRCNNSACGWGTSDGMQKGPCPVCDWGQVVPYRETPAQILERCKRQAADRDRQDVTTRATKDDLEGVYINGHKVDGVMSVGYDFETPAERFGRLAHEALERHILSGPPKLPVTLDLGDGVTAKVVAIKDDIAEVEVTLPAAAKDIECEVRIGGTPERSTVTASVVDGPLDTSRFPPTPVVAERGYYYDGEGWRESRGLPSAIMMLDGTLVRGKCYTRRDGRAFILYGPHDRCLEFCAARGVTKSGMLVTGALDRPAPGEEPTLGTSTGERLDMLAEHLYGLKREFNETDAALRWRCRMAYERIGPPPPTYIMPAALTAPRRVSPAPDPRGTRADIDEVLRTLRIDRERVSEFPGEVRVRGMLTGEQRAALVAVVAAFVKVTDVPDHDPAARQAAHDSAVYRAKRGWR